MNISQIKGLKYPDEYFIKFFFKNEFHQKKALTFLELGCSNGCNLSLPYQYNFETLGVDLDETLIGYANENFKVLSQKNTFKFYMQDMRTFCNNSKDINADVLILANSLYYIPKDDFILLLRNIKDNGLIKKNAIIFIRFRELDDYRNGKGKEIEENGYILENGKTGEDGAFCQFYNTETMINILNKELNLKNFKIMNIRYDNIQHNTKIENSDVVIWGDIN